MPLVYRGVEQWQLAWLITTRSQVRVLAPLPRKKTDPKGWVFFLGRELVPKLELRVPGENCQWQFGNEPSPASLLARQKFGGRGT